MNKKNIDFILLGGGCSSLSLINNIIERKITNYSFIIIEKRKKYLDDKSWCFWDTNNSKFKNLASKGWSKFSFSANNKTKVLTSNKNKYYYIKSINFYNSVLKNIKKASNVLLRLDEEVISIKTSLGLYNIKTNKNSYTAKNILDTRIRLDVFKKYPFMYQSFLGYEIEINKKNKIALNQAHIMKNMESLDDFFCFDYILPIKKNVFLFEFTVFSKQLYSVSFFKKRIINRLKNHYDGEFKIIRKEFGVIPMGFVDRDKTNFDKNYILGGTIAGAVRPSSGYAFLRIQKWALECAINIERKGYLMRPIKDNLLLTILDKIFLIVLCKKTNLSSKIFFHFTSNINANTFVKFMSGNANIIDYVKVVLAMPKYVFVKCFLSK